MVGPTLEGSGSIPMGEGNSAEKGEAPYAHPLGVVFRRLHQRHKITIPFTSKCLPFETGGLAWLALVSHERHALEAPKSIQIHHPTRPTPPESRQEKRPARSPDHGVSVKHSDPHQLSTNRQDWRLGPAAKQTARRARAQDVPASGPQRLSGSLAPCHEPPRGRGGSRPGHTAGRKNGKRGRSPFF